MEKDRYIGFNASDFILDDDFNAWIRGEDQNAEQSWEHWLKLHPREENEARKARQILLSLNFSHKEVEADRVEAEWQSLLGQLDSPDLTEETETGSARSFPWWPRLIAASVALLMLVWVGKSFFSLLTEQRAANGQQLTIKLTDGTVIQLNAGSSLTYPEEFLADKREVQLKGEAYFEVAPNAEAPFFIYTDDVRVKVLGTKFTVKAYPESSNVKVAVVEGKVAVNPTVAKGKKEVLEAKEAFLTKDEMATVEKTNQELKVSTFDKNDLLGWKNGILYFEKASFPQIVNRLERWYGVSIKVEQTMEMDTAWRFSGKFENKSIDYILDVCRYPNQFTYEVADNEVIIK